MKKRNLLLIHINIFAIIIIISLIIITSFFGFNKTLHKNLDTKTESSMYDITSHNIDTINSKVEGLSSLLETVALWVAEYENIYDQEVIDKIYRFSEKNKSTNIMVINKEGKAYTEAGIEYDVSGRAYFKEVLKGQPVVSGNIVSKISNEEAIIIAVPMYRKGEVIGAIAGVYNLKLFTEIMNVDIVDSKGYSIILKKDGQIIAKPTGIQSENVFDEILSLKIASDYDEQNMKTNFKNNKSGLFEYVYKDNARVASYAPIGINDWFVVSIISSDAVEKKHNDIDRMTLYLVLITIICFGTLTFCIVFIIEKSNTEIREKITEIARITMYMPGGAKKTLTDKEYTFLEYTDGFLKLIGYTKEEITTLFDNKLMNMIYPEDTQEVEITIRNQLKNCNETEVEYRIRKKDGSLIWVLDKGKRVIDEHNRENLYCVVIDITAQKESQEQLEYEKERFKKVLDISDDILFDYDIEKDEIIYSEKYKKVMGRESNIKNYMQNLNKSNYIYEGDCVKFTKFINNITKKDSPKTIELRIKKEKGGYIWFNMQIAVVTDKTNTPIKLMGKLSGIDKQKKENNKILELIEIDSLTKLYNKKTTEKKIETYIGDEGKNSEHVLMIVRVENSGGMDDGLGQLFEDETLKIISSKIKKMFRTSDIIGYMGADCFLVFMKNVLNEDIIIKKAEEICGIFKYTQREDDKEYRVSGNIGISRYPKDGLSYSELFGKADLALHNEKNTEKDSYRVHEEIADN